MGVDLNSLVPSLVNVGYDLAADVVTVGSYAHTSATVYDPSTGGPGATTQTDASVSLIRSPVDSKLIDGNQVRAGDEQFVIRSTEFLNVSAHSVGDKVTIGSDIWVVMDFRLDPTGSVYIMRVRRLNT